MLCAQPQRLEGIGALFIAKHDLCSDAVSSRPRAPGTLPEDSLRTEEEPPQNFDERLKTADLSPPQWWLFLI